jgi:hypothetical protein
MKMNRKIVDEGLGWYGMVAIVAAYAMVSLGLLSFENIVYQLLNLTGASGLLYISFRKNAYQPGVLNSIWAVIALIAILRMII